MCSYICSHVTDSFQFRCLAGYSRLQNNPEDSDQNADTPSGNLHYDNMPMLHTAIFTIAKK